MKEQITSLGNEAPEASAEFLKKIFSSNIFSNRVKKTYTTTVKLLEKKMGYAETIPEFGFLILKLGLREIFFIPRLIEGKAHSMSSEIDFDWTRCPLYLFPRGESRKYLALCHFHPPSPGKRLLKPSVYSPDEGAGDLYFLYSARKFAQSPLSSYPTKMIGIVGGIDQADPHGHPVKLLFYQEGEWIQNMPESEFLNTLWCLQLYFEINVPSSQQQILNALRAMGYTTEYFEIPEQRLSQDNLFSQEDLKRMEIFAF